MVSESFALGLTLLFISTKNVLVLILNLHCIGLGRRVLIFPKGNNADYLSMYLDVADSAMLPYGWRRYAQFSLAVVNQVHGKLTIRKGIFYNATGSCLCD